MRFWIGIGLFFCFAVQLAAQNRSELGYQTTGRGIVWYRNGLPTHKPQWRLSQDTNKVMWVDTFTTLRYDWSYKMDVWYTKGTSTSALPPKETVTSGSATIDNRTVFWISNNILHYYSHSDTAFVPFDALIVASAAPSNIAAGGSNAAAKYTTSLWQDKDDHKLYRWDGAAWVEIGTGAADNWGTQVVQRDSSLQGNGTTASPLGVKGYGAASNGQVPSKATGGITWITPLTAEVDGDPLNEAWTIDGDDSDSEVISSQIVKFEGGGINLTDYNPATNTLLITGTELDGSPTNELQTIDVSGISGTILSLSLSSDPTTNTVDFGNMLATRGVDSAWVKYSGSYLNKRITDNLYRFGTTSLRSSDTTGIFNIYAQAHSKAAIYSRYTDASTNGFLFFQLDPDGQTDNATLGNFNFWATNFVGANSPYSTRANHVWRMGYNTGQGGGRIITTDADLHIAFESNFYNTYHTGRIKRSWEWHLESADTVGGIHRMITARGSHSGSDGDLGINTDLIAFQDYNNNPKGWLSFTYGTYTKGLTFSDTAIIQFGKPQPLVDLIRARNAANSNYLSLLQTDASDRAVFPKSIMDVYSYAPNLIFNTLATITTNDGNPVQIGDITRKSYVSIYAPGTEVLRLRSDIGGANLWRTYVNSGDISYTLPSGSAYLQFYTNSTYILGANDRIGIGTSPSSRFHIRQNGNGGGNGFQMTNSDASFSYYQAVDASGRLVWYQTGGATRMVLDQTGSLAVGTTTNPVSKLDVEGGATIGATYAGTDVAPANGAIIEGNVGIGNNNPSQKLHVTGNARVTGAIYDSNNDAGASGEVLKSTITGTDWSSSQSVSAFTRTMPTSVNSVVWIGVLNKPGNGATNFQLDIHIQGGSVSIGKTYIVASSYNSSGNSWELLLPAASTGSFSSSDFEVEIRGNNNLDSLRIRRTLGTASCTAYCELRWANGGTNTFTAISTTNAPPTISNTFREAAIAQVDNKVGINNVAPARSLHVTGETRITDLATDTPTRIVGADSDGDLDTVGIGAEAELHLTNGTLGTNFHTTISPSQLTATQNDWNPTGLSTAWIIRLSGDASFRLITGIVAPSFAKRLILHNTGSDAILLPTQHTGSSAANRFNFGRDVILFGGKSIEIVYDPTTSRWRLLSKAGIYDDVEQNYINYKFVSPVSTTSADYDFWEVSSTAAASLVAPQSGLFGGVSVNTGTSSTGNGYVASKEDFFYTGNSADNATWAYAKAVIITPSSLSDGSNEYTLRIGFLTDAGGGNANDGVYFRYTHSLSSGQWAAVTTAGGSSSATSSGVTVSASSIYLLEVYYLPNTTARFFINGSLVATNTSLIPVNDEMKIIAEIEKSVGTSQRAFSIHNLTTSVAIVH